MKITREKLTFEFLEALHEEHERDPLPTHTVMLDDIWKRVTGRHRRVTAELASVAFNQLYAGHLINQWNHQDGKKEIQLNERGLAAYNQMKGQFKSTKKEREEYNFKLLTAILAIAGLIVMLIKFVLFHQ